MAMEDLTECVGKNKIKEEQDDWDKEILRPSQVQSFLECKKATDRRA